MRVFIIFCSLLIAFNSYLIADEIDNKIKTFLTEKTYQTNANFIKKIFSNKKSFYNGSQINITKVLNTLKNNGLLTLKLPKPNNISVSFRINPTNITDREPSFMFLSYTISNILSNMGYSYFYVTRANKNKEKISLTYTLNSESIIDPTVLISNLERRGYLTIDVNKASQTHWVYDISLVKANITHSMQIKSGETKLTQVNGKYWITIDTKGEIEINANELNQWSPKILIFDSNMNLLDAIMSKDIKDTTKLKINEKMRFLMITDNYNPSLLRNGITINFKEK